jgi:hypothetical protein
MFWMTALLGMEVMGSLDFFSADPIGETDVDDDTVGDTIDDDLDLSGPENQRDAPLLDHGIADFWPRKHSPAQVLSRCAAATRQIA